MPFPDCRSGAIGLVIAGNPENDGHLQSWQEAVGRRSRAHTGPGTHKNRCAHEAPTGLTIKREKPRPAGVGIDPPTAMLRCGIAAAIAPAGRAD